MALDPGLSSAAGISPYRDYGEPASDDDDDNDNPGAPENPYEPGAPDNPYDERYSSAFDNGGGSPTADIFGGNRTNDGGDSDNGGGSPTADIFGGNRTNDGGDSDRDRSPVEEIYTSTGGSENDMPPNNGSSNPPPRDNSGPSNNTTSSSGSDPVSNPDPEPPQTPGAPENPFEPGAPENPFGERYSSAFSEEVIERTQDTFDGFDMDMSGNGFGLSTVALAALVVGILGAIAGRETGMGQ